MRSNLTRLAILAILAAYIVIAINLSISRIVLNDANHFFRDLYAYDIVDNSDKFIFGN